MSAATKAQIIAERDAYIKGARLVLDKLGMKWDSSRDIVESAARASFPVPLVTRPRTAKVALPGRMWEFKVEAGVQYRRLLSGDCRGYENHGRWTPTSWTALDLRRLLSIFEQPTETVEIQ